MYQICSDTFGLSCVAISFSNETTLEDFSDGILIDNDSKVPGDVGVSSLFLSKYTSPARIPLDAVSYVFYFWNSMLTSGIHRKMAHPQLHNHLPPLNHGRLLKSLKLL